MSEATIQEILNLEEQLRQAEMRVDPEVLDAFFADEIMVTAPIGVVVDKAAVMSEVKRATKATIDRYDKEDINVRVFGDMAVTSYRVKATARSNEGRVDRTFRMSNVWLKREGRWQVVSRHAATIEQQKVEQRSA